MISHAGTPPTDIAGYDPTEFDGEFWYDPHSAELAVEFIERQCCHVKGSLAGKPFIMEDWQANAVRTIYGWKRQDGTRRYRQVFTFLPRKNGKSLWLSAMVLAHVFVPQFQDAGAEIYSAASDRDQAALVFNMAASIIRRNPMMAKRVKILDSVKRIAWGDNFYRAIPADAGGSHGYNSSMIACDELHAWPGERGREFYDVLQTSTGARTEPLCIDITTAGYDKHSICYQQFAKAVKVRENPRLDEAFLPVLYFAGEDDDWTDPATWRKANPNLGVSITEDYLKRECRKAIESPVYENTFRRLHLNQWTEQNVRWLPLQHWDQCSHADGRDAYDQWLASLEGLECCGGLDLSSTVDLTALALAFEGGAKVPVWYWIPEERMRERSQRDRVPYELWVKQKWITATPGNVVDYDRIRNDVLALSKRFQIHTIAIDRWNATQLATQLAGDGLEIVEFGQGYASMSAPSKELERRVIDHTLDHGGHPVSRWCAQNVTAEQDAAGNIKPSKGKSTERIDGIVAAVMAIGEECKRVEDGGSMYAEKGNLWL